MFSAQTGAELLKAVLKSTLVGCVTGFISGITGRK